MRRALLILLAAGMLAACANSADEGAAPPSSADAGAGSDGAAGSSMVTPVGGDLRIGTSWYLVGTSLSSLLLPSDLTITFEADTVGGPGPVNSWTAGYTATPDGDLELTEIASTLMAGSEEDLRAEDAYFALLREVDGYTTVEGGELYLFDDQANTLVYSVHPPVEDPTAISDETQALAAGLVGLAEADAQAAVEAANHTFRVVARDGEQFAVTEDWSKTRINVTVEDDKVTEATVG